MLCFRKPSQELISDFLNEQKDKSFTYPNVKGTSDYATKEQFRKDDRYQLYDLDQHRIKLGQGYDTFKRGVEGLQSWKPFFMEWVELCYPSPPQVGNVVAVVAKAFGVWTVSACKIVYIVNETDDSFAVKRFGFAYGTLEQHVAKGEERFMVEWDTTSNDVYFDIMSFSQPGSWFTKIGYPAARFIQDSFGVEAMKVMYEYVNDTGVKLEMNFI